MEPEASAFEDFAAPGAEAWITTTVRRARSLAFAPDLEILDRTLPVCEGELGALADERFRRLVSALLVADWATYDGTDRVDLERLAFVAARSPAGFRLYAARLPHRGALVPIGYAAHYPVASGTAEALVAGTIPGRAVIPAPEGPEVWVMNYGLAPGFRRTPVAKRLLVCLADELGGSSLATLTVSEDGARIARRLGMKLVARRGSEAIFASPRAC